MPKLTIDGREIEVSPGTTVIEAASRAGIPVPYYCWHPGLSVAGNCRMCLVEIEKMPKLAIACSTACADGMLVRTTNDRVKEARDAIMEFLLINHPLDCPICDQAGECRLQEYSYRYGSAGSRFVEEKVHKPKRVDIGTHVMFDAERCILCSRCVRFCEEVSKTGELTIGMRGDHAIVETFPGRRLDNPYSGNTVDICPVGALTLKEFRFRSRVWFLENTPSVCPGCARGCSITIGARGGKILRYVPRENPEVNRWWMCDEGRLSWKRLDAAPRLASPAVRGQRTAWPRAIEHAASALGSVRRARGAGAVALLLSPRAANEDLYLAALLASEALGGSPVFLARHERGENDDLLIRKDKTSNSRGAEEILGALLGRAAGRVIRSSAELGAAIRSGEVKALVMVGDTLAGLHALEPPPLAVEDLALLETLCLLDSFRTPAADKAHVLLPALAFGEFEGTFTNFLGQVQRVRAALSPRADAWPVWKAIQELGRMLAGAAAATAFPQFSGSQAVFAALAGDVPAYAGLSYAALGERGRSLAAAPAARPGSAGQAEGGGREPEGGGREPEGGGRRPEGGREPEARAG